MKKMTEPISYSDLKCQVMNLFKTANAVGYSPQYIASLPNFDSLGCLETRTLLVSHLLAEMQLQGLIQEIEGKFYPLHLDTGLTDSEIAAAYIRRLFASAANKNTIYMEGM